MPKSVFTIEDELAQAAVKLATAEGCTIQQAYAKILWKDPQKYDDFMAAKKRLEGLYRRPAEGK